MAVRTFMESKIKVWITFIVFAYGYSTAQVTNGSILNRVKGYSYNTGNLVANGSFENNYDDGTYEGWYEGLDRDPTIISPIDESEDVPSYEGYKHIAVTYTTPTAVSQKNRFRIMSDLFPLKPLTPYTLFFRYRARDLNLRGGTIYPTVHFWKAKGFTYDQVSKVFEFETENGQPSSEIGPTQPGTAYSAQSEWTLSTLQFTTPSETNFGNLFLLFGSVDSASGTFFFDDVYLTEGSVSPGDVANLGHPSNIGATMKFLDGNNRVIQNVTQDGNRDIVTQTFNDELGRIQKTTLPIGHNMGVNQHHFFPGITADNTTGDSLALYYNPDQPGSPPLDDILFDPSPGATPPQYPDAEGVAYSELRYEDSPLGRIVESADPGIEWKMGTQHTLRTIYSSVPTLDDDPTFPDTPDFTNPFFVVEAFNRNGKLSRETKDRLGRVLRKSAMLGNGWVNTDYTYDANGNATVIEAPGIGIRQTQLAAYDANNRKISDSSAATGNTRYIYDDMGRLRFSQTANQSKAGSFSFVRYDSLSRVLETGEILDTSYFTPGDPSMANTREFPCLQNCIDPTSNLSSSLVKYRTVNQYDFEGGSLSCQTGSGGNSSSGPTTPADVLFLAERSTGEVVASGYTLWNAYEDAINALQGQTEQVQILALFNPNGNFDVVPDPGAEFVPVGNLTFTFEGLSISTTAGAAALTAFQNLEAAKIAQPGSGAFTRGRLVNALSCNYELAQALGENTPREVSKSFAYDKYGNVTQMVETNRYVKDANRQVQVVKNTYDVQNRLSQKTVCDDPDCNLSQSHVEKYQYDQLGRVSKVLDKQDVALLQNHYNYIGQKSYQSLGSDLGYSTTTNALFTSRSYHLHGWVEQIETERIRDNHSLFLENLSYEEGPIQDFDGNITKTSFTYEPSLSSRKNLAFSYGYDDLGRLVSAQDVTQATNPDGTPLVLPDAGSSYSYLDDGRLNMQRRGSKTGTYQYGDNGRLLGVAGDLVDQRDMNLLGKPYVFKYDANGNLIADTSKAHDGHPLEIYYRSDNLPYLFVYRLAGSNQEHVVYMAYDESGNRVSKEEDVDDQWTQTKSYFSVGKEIREHDNTTVEFYGMAGVGRVEYPIGYSSGLKDFYLTDHLGSTREMYALNTGVMTYATHYLPYGKEFASFQSQTENVTERFTGKEFEDGFNLDYFGARFYDPELGVWISPDAARHFCSPYAYSPDPINSIDPDGNEPVETIPEEAPTYGYNVLLGLLLFIPPEDPTFGEEAGDNPYASEPSVGGLADALPRPPQPDPSPTQSSPNFVVAPSGTAIPIPNGATGPTPTRAPGVQFLGGSGGAGMDPDVTGVRIMDPNRNQGSRAIYMNRTGQTVNPSTGRTVSNDDPNGHHYFQMKP